MSSEQVEIRRGLYADSVTLMRVSQRVGQGDGVEAAMVAMATELNLAVLAGMAFSLPPVNSANDLVIAVRARDDAAASRAISEVERYLAESRARPSGAAGADDVPPRTVGSAARQYGAGLALISVPGKHAFTEALDALEADCDVLIFSDNVGIDQEITLKDYATKRGRLVMGPDCGTAVVGGIGIGFSHTLDRGPVGVVAASGTGAQQVLCLLDAADVGITAALGVGGRDLSREVAGRSTLAALKMLDDDPDTDVIVVVSKPPAPEVAAALHQIAAGLHTPVEFAMLAADGADLTAATERVLARLDIRPPDWPSWPARKLTAVRGPWLRGLFCGGTLCDEAMLIATADLGPIWSNIPLDERWRLGPDLMHSGHSMIDFGDDALTVGRAHPMIDPTLRTAQLAQALADPDTGVLLLDVVLGHAAHPDPAGPVAELIADSGMPVVVSLIGARRDPQSLAGSADRLQAAGAAVFTSNAMAVRHAVGLIRQSRSSGRS
jgi:FdrA protein